MKAVIRRTVGMGIVPMRRAKIGRVPEPHLPLGNGGNRRFVVRVFVMILAVRPVRVEYALQRRHEEGMPMIDDKVNRRGHGMRGHEIEDEGDGAESVHGA